MRHDHNALLEAVSVIDMHSEGTKDFTKCNSAPAAHHGAKSLNNFARLNWPPLGLSLLVELVKRHGGNFVTAELCEQFLLCREVEILVCLNLFLLRVEHMRPRHPRWIGDLPKSPPYRKRHRRPEYVCDMQA